MRRCGWCQLFPVITRCGCTGAGQLRDKFEAQILSAAGRVPKAFTVGDHYVRLLRGMRRWRRGRSGRRGTIYARFSSRYQHSIADQIRVCREWAQANGVDVADRHVFFDEKTTGKKNRRAGFGAMMQAVIANEVDAVIIFTTSRLFRKTYRSLRFVEEEVVDRSKRCVFVKSGIDTDDRENWRKLLHLHSLVDEMQITIQAAHIRAGHEGQLRMGIVFGTLTYGYRGEPIDGQTTRQGKPARRLAIDPETSTWVQRIFAWFVTEELSIAEIVRRLNAAAVTAPDRSETGRWTRLIVRRILDNTRYIGRWKYGATEVVWQNKADYGRQFEREEPLAQMDFPHLRIIDDGLWYQAQKRLADHHASAGRKPRNGDRQQYPRLLNRLCYCEKHRDQQLWVGGKNGKYLFCPLCRTDPQPALVTQLPRVLATKLICQSIANALQADATLVDRAIQCCRQYAEAQQQPDPQALERKRQEEQRLTQRINFVLQAPGETEQDQAENHAVVANLRRQRAALQTEVRALEEAMAKPIRVPSVVEITGLIQNLSEVLIEAVGGQDDRKVAAARRLLEAVTGGRIVISQQGELKARRGWLRASFSLHLVNVVTAASGTVTQSAADAVVHVDVRQPTRPEELAEEVKALWDQDKLVKQIAAKLGISRNLATKALAHWFTSRGIEVPDGRTRRSALAQKSMDPTLPQRIADRVMALCDQGRLYAEIAAELDVDHSTLTAAVRHWHASRGLPVPDGRRRRKTLQRKSRSPAPKTAESA